MNKIIETIEYILDGCQEYLWQVTEMLNAATVARQ